MSGRRPGKGWANPLPSGPVVLATWVGGADGSRAAAAALACAASDPDRAALLVDLDADRAPRPTPIATAGARGLEERLAAHIPGAAVAARGATCCLRPAPDADAVGQLAAALPLARESAAIVHLPPGMLRPLLEDPRIRPTAALLRADLAADRPLTALTTRDLLDRGLRVKVLKRPLGWLPGRAALLGAPIPVAGNLSSQLCYGRQHDAETEPAGVAQPERRDHAGAGQGRGLHRHPQRGAGR